MCSCLSCIVFFSLFLHFSLSIPPPLSLELSLSLALSFSSTLEDALHTHSQDPILQSLYFPDQLYRTSSIVQDLQYYIAQNEGLTLSEKELEAHLVPSPATKVYVDNLKKLSQETPYLLLSHGKPCPK